MQGKLWAVAGTGGPGNILLVGNRVLRFGSETDGDRQAGPLQPRPVALCLQQSRTQK